ncbi:hypothetical protein BSL78_24098 [Apostichopus japonicus]|uniref:Uncharacterized protein n=1 Tax=Stichopus japonicus TaxID=307972 RepID=A0A2G8JTH9_STIJA|nr:hypothetical protein BSL78_24098 [Apostichopus japonicus]
MESDLGKVDLTNVSSSKALHAPLRGSVDVSKGNVEALHGDPSLQSHAGDGDDQALPSDCKGDHTEDVAGVIRDPFNCDENVGNLMARKDGDGGVDDGYTSSEEGEQGTPDGSSSESNLASDGRVTSYVTGDASVALEGSGASNTGVGLVKGGMEISDMKGEISEKKEDGMEETRTTVTVDLSQLEERQPSSDEIGQGEPEKSVDSVTSLDKDVSDIASEGASQEGENGQSHDTDANSEENVVNMSDKMLPEEASDAGSRNADMSHQEERGQCQDSNVNRMGNTTSTWDNVTIWQEEANDVSSGYVMEDVTGKADLEEDGVERNESEEICPRIVESDIEEKDEEVDESCNTISEVSEHQTVCGESKSVQDEEKKCEVPSERDEDEEETDAGEREGGLNLKGKSVCDDGEEGSSQGLCFMDSSSLRDQTAEADERLREDCSVEMSKNVDPDNEPLGVGGGETKEQLQMGDLSFLEEGKTREAKALGIN